MLAPTQRAAQNSIHSVAHYPRTHAHGHHALPLAAELGVGIAATVTSALESSIRRRGPRRRAKSEDGSEKKKKKKKKKRASSADPDADTQL